MGAEKTKLFGSIFLFNSILRGIIDFLLIPILISKFSYIGSIIITLFIYLLIGIISVKIYDFYKIDCLRIEILKKAQYDNDQIVDKSNIVKLILKWTNKSKFVLGILLAGQNSGLAVIYLRDSFYLYNGFHGKNIKLYFFIYSLIISIYWNTAVSGILTIKDLT